MRAASHEDPGGYMQDSVLRTVHPALREGLVFGVIIGIITFATNLLHNFLNSNTLISIIGVLFLIITIALNLLAGVRASRQTGRVGTGALAGLIMQLISSLFGVISILTELFVFNSILHRLFQSLSPAATSAMAQQFITAGIISTVVILLVGAVIGAIGGLIGRRIQFPMNV